MNGPRAARRADPRVERSRQVILRAALDELGEAGYGAFTIESVAARAGVGKSTIYRHWPDRVALIAEAFEAAHQHAVPPIEGLTARQGLERLLRHVAETVTDPAFSAPIPALIEGAERDARLQEFRHRYSALRRDTLTSLIRQGAADGEFRAPADPDLAAQALLGPIFYQRLLTGEPLDPSRVGELIDTVLGSTSAQEDHPRVRSWITPKAVKGGASTIEGQGVHAVEAIAAGEVVAVKGGHVVTGSVVAGLPEPIRDSAFPIAPGLFLAALTVGEYEGVMMRVNHSCEPNVGMGGDAVLVSTRDIAPGEELTTDYALFLGDPAFAMECRCGTAACRGVIHGTDWMRADLQARYGGWFAWWLSRPASGRGPR